MTFFQTANSTVPLWIILPLGMLAALVISVHLAALPRAEMPPSRRRIRMANGVMLLALTVLLTYALGFVGMLPDGGGSIGHIRAFVLVWMAIIGLLPIVLGLAAMDMFNTWRLQRDALRLVRAQRRGEMLREVEIHVKAHLSSRGGRVVSDGGRGMTGGAGDDAEQR